MKYTTYKLKFTRWLSRTLATRQRLSLKVKLIVSVFIFLISFSIKSLQAVDLEPTMHTADQPGGGMSSDFDERALSITHGEGIMMPDIGDRSNTSLLANAPGYPIFLSAIYSWSGRSYFTVQLVQNAINSVSAVLIFFIAGNLISWRVGIASGLLAAVSHHLSYYSNLVLSDSLCPLPILIAVYILVRVGLRRGSLWLYALSGSMIGLSAWIRPNPMLMGLWISLFFIVPTGRRRRAILNGMVLTLASFLTIAPITIRNYVLYSEFVPIRIGVGIVVWQGLGEASDGRFGAKTDDEVIIDEVTRFNNDSYGESWAFPDGIMRDRDRLQRSLEIIRSHPIWYLGTMFERMGEMLKDTAHAPLVFRSTDTKLRDALTLSRAAKTRRELSRQYDPQFETIDRSALRIGRSLSWLRAPARAAQRVTKEAGLFVILAGVAIMLIGSLRRALLLLMVPIYYLLFQSIMHTEFRYTLAMRYFLFVFAAIVWTLVLVTAGNLIRNLAFRTIKQRDPATSGHPH